MSVFDEDIGLRFVSKVLDCNKVISLYDYKDHLVVANIPA